MQAWLHVQNNCKQKIHEAMWQGDYEEKGKHKDMLHKTKEEQKMVKGFKITLRDVTNATGRKDAHKTFKWSEEMEHDHKEHSNL